MDTAALRDAYAHRLNALLWGGQGKYASYAKANPGEAAKIDAYVSSVVAGQAPVAPLLKSDFGQLIVGLIAAGVQPASSFSGSVSLGPSAAYHGSVGVKPVSMSGAVKVTASLDGGAPVDVTNGYALDTTKLANGTHALLYVFYTAVGAEAGRVQTSIQVVN